ncbi:MAG TPA: FkbM family methyltransferase [Lacipirellulaceae bacterium]|nr:FkbM family methyltransferase [Lacipirellulaceae bacterium]HMP05973.1 FkbM family methyltransferase [Lacipirellulaceae bacterium]
MTPGGTFVDVGANVGLYTSVIANIPGANCIAIEPNARAFTRLATNASRSKSSHIRLINVALASSHTLLEMVTPSGTNLGMTRVTNCVRAKSWSVYAVPMHELLTTLNITSITLLKIDVEGYESEVLRGLKLDGNEAPENIIMEHLTSVDEWQPGLSYCVDLLRANGYKAHTVEGTPLEQTEVIPEDNVWWKRTH